MFAIIETGGRHLRVQPNKIVEIERIETPENQIVKFKKVLLVSDGEKILEASNASVTARVLNHFRGEKVIAFHKHRRTSGFTKRRGHRQNKTQIFIETISV